MNTRKMIAALFVLGTAFAFTSCTKNYTCTCTVSGGQIVIDLNKYKKGDAEDACTSAENTYKIGDPAASCTLKKK